MTRLSNALAGLAAAGLALAQPTVAAAQDSEGGMLADSPGAAPVIGLLALLGVLFGIMALTDDDDESPVSP